jgi:hypothetical protein
MVKQMVRWLLVGSLILFSTYLVQQIAQQYEHSGTFTFIQWTCTLFVVLAFTSAFGLVFSWSWSQYIFYILAFVTAAFCGYGIWLVYCIRRPHMDVVHTFISLIPGALLVALCLVSSILVFSYFRSLKE